MNTLTFQDQVDINDHLHQTLRQPKPRSSLRGKINMKRSLKLINREMAKSKNTPRLKNYDMKIHDVCRFHISQIKQIDFLRLILFYLIANKDDESLLQKIHLKDPLKNQKRPQLPMDQLSYKAKSNKKAISNLYEITPRHFTQRQEEVLHCRNIKDSLTNTNNNRRCDDEIKKRQLICTDTTNSRVIGTLGIYQHIAAPFVSGKLMSEMSSSNNLVWMEAMSSYIRNKTAGRSFVKKQRASDIKRSPDSSSISKRRVCLSIHFQMKPNIFTMARSSLEERSSLRDKLNPHHF